MQIEFFFARSRIFFESDEQNISLNDPDDLAIFIEFSTKEIPFIFLKFFFGKPLDPPLAVISACAINFFSYPYYVSQLIF